MKKPKTLSKADVLKWLRPRLKHSYIEDIFDFTVGEWKDRPRDISNRILSTFSPKRIIVRSSSLNEDSLLASQAGCFHSELGVKTIKGEVVSAVNRVITSYKKMGNSITDKNKILVQAETGRVAVSGVVFTRQIETNAPYYVINYDEETGKTNTVTGGRESRTTYISHFTQFNSEKRWQKLLKAVREVEEFFPGQVLDIEFAITRNGKVVIFQVRPLAANRLQSIPNDAFVEDILKDMAQKFKRYSKREPHLAGKRTIFGDMPDWNPSEIIGSRPNTLDYTIYSFIVTDEIWHQARSSLGYYDVYPAELMVSFGKKPYIDTRPSFNSFTPAGISHRLREKIMNYYMDKLEQNQALQDKVEFQILWTCYDFSVPNGLKDLYKQAFRKEEVREFQNALHQLTNNILSDFRDITDYDLGQVRFLTDRRNTIMKFYETKKKSPWNSLYTAYNILQNCKKFGTFPFSRQARLAFIAKSLFISLNKQSIVPDNAYHDFLNSIRTVASQLNDDFYLLGRNKLNRDEFLKHYGHLRAGTYDITAPRYDKQPYLFKKHNTKKISKRPRRKGVVSEAVIRKITKVMKDHKLYGDGKYLLNFIKSAVENREYAKFEFTRSLSDALELIAEAGDMLGFKRDELCHADLSTIMKFRNPEHGDVDYAKKIIGQSIKRHRKERNWYDAAILPPLITSEKDLYFLRPYRALPNFITQKSIQGEIMGFDDIKKVINPILKKHVLLLENADPGFDWIFTKNPLGIITKYGGVASHMSIRCAEFGIPAAIGCGEVLYNQLKKSKIVMLDCGKRILRPLSYY